MTTHSTKVRLECLNVEDVLEFFEHGSDGPRVREELLRSGINPSDIVKDKQPLVYVTTNHGEVFEGCKFLEESTGLRTSRGDFL